MKSDHVIYLNTSEKMKVFVLKSQVLHATDHVEHKPLKFEDYLIQYLKIQIRSECVVELFLFRPKGGHSLAVIRVDSASTPP